MRTVALLLIALLFCFVQVSVAANGVLRWHVQRLEADTDYYLDVLVSHSTDLAGLTAHIANAGKICHGSMGKHALLSVGSCAWQALQSVLNLLDHLKRSVPLYWLTFKFAKKHYCYCADELMFQKSDDFLHTHHDEL